MALKRRSEGGSGSNSALNILQRSIMHGRDRPASSWAENAWQGKRQFDETTSGDGLQMVGIRIAVMQHARRR